ncbi:MAG: hypothetical protein DI562_02725 [Stenotrophomonas acidaminiphila]|jgi:hypothetical protein|nr:MAG: hypothetical protein DI562_02725 [Stenotrophomonas acidaminiphila]
MNKHDIDKISLEQALIDVEIANRRVLDLTARLTKLSRELLEARGRINGNAVQSIDYGLTSGDEKLRQIAASRVYRLARLFSPRLRRLL